ncbi:hypothetical protein IJT93_04865, partial [bacterium]|nr:hypothetical protein [bacterium]
MDENYLSLNAPLQFNSSFSDLESFWPYAADLGRLAEVQAPLSPERSLVALGSLGEAAVRALTRVYMDKEAAGSREQLNELMEKQRPCPDEIYDCLQALLRLRDAELPDVSAERRVLFGLSLAYSVCQWLEAVFADAPKLSPTYETPAYLSESAGNFQTPDLCAEYAENLHRRLAQCGAGLPGAFTSPKPDKSALRSLGQKTRPYQPLSADQRELLTALLLSLQVVRENELFLSYAQSCNNVSVFDEITVVNGSSRDLSDLELTIISEQDVFKPCRQSLASLPKFGSTLIRAPKLEYNPDFLASLTESAEGRIIIEISSGSALLLRRLLPLKLYAYDQTAGWRFRPELLCAYVMPNHPEIAKITADAVRLLEKWTKNPSLDGYQSDDPNRVLRMAASVYGALQQQNIVYAVAPASFDFTGQRVRLPEIVMQRKMGNCMDLSLLYAACLEAIGLHPVLICIREHMFTGVWLTDSI